MSRYVWPREHGSWGILLFPFLSAVVLAGGGNLLSLAAFAAAMAAFMAREPLIVVSRQRWVWKQPKPETEAAWRTLWIVLPIAALSGVALWLGGVDMTWLLGLGAVAVTLTAVSVYATLHQLQRSTALQVVGSFGLTLSAALAWLSAGRAPDRTLALLVAAQTIHATGGVLTVHARLEALQSRKAAAPKLAERTAALGWQAVQALAAAWAAFTGEPLLALSLAVPLAIHLFDLLRLDRESVLRTPLKTVGFRELFLSLLVSVLIVVALW